MLNINIQIDDPDFELKVADSITLQEGDDLSKEITNIYLDDLKSRANRGLDKYAERQVKDAIQLATEQKKASFDVLIEAVKPKEIIKGK